MYKKLIYKTTVVMALLLSSTSCNKYLTLYPQDGTIKQEFWKNKEQVNSAVIGVYSSLLAGTNSTTGRSLAETLFLWGELRADNLTLTGNSTVEDQNIVNDNVLPTNSICQWNKVYATINYCNTVLDFAPGVMAVDPTFTQAKLDAYRSEMLTIRALMYFYLVRTFGDVPLKLTSTTSDADLKQIGVTKQADILKQIVADLKTAESTAVFTYGDQASDKGRVTKYLVNTLQADVYLWMEDYQNCIDACDKVINSQHFGLIKGNTLFFQTLYVNGNSNESIFEFQFDSGANGNANEFLTAMYSKARFTANANVLANVFTNSDPYGIDLRGIGVSLNINTGLIWKYVGIDNTQKNVRTSTGTSAHWFVYRYADVLLMKAEACAWVGGRGADAMALIKQVRDRANALSATDESASVGDPTLPSAAYAISTYVLDERDREFAFEGKRWFDLVRHGKRSNFAHPEILTNAIALVAPANLVQSIVSKYQDHNSWYLPIYYLEIQNDPNLVQNSFYR
jgi:hypothetical protein